MAFEVDPKEQKTFNEQLEDNAVGHVHKKERRKTCSFTLPTSLKNELDRKAEQVEAASTSRFLEKLIKDHINDY